MECQTPLHTLYRVTHSDSSLRGLRGLVRAAESACSSSAMRSAAAAASVSRSSLAWHLVRRVFESVFGSSACIQKYLTRSLCISNVFYRTRTTVEPKCCLILCRSDSPAFNDVRIEWAAGACWHSSMVSVSSAAFSSRAFVSCSWSSDSSARTCSGAVRKSFGIFR